VSASVDDIDCAKCSFRHTIVVARNYTEKQDRNKYIERLRRTLPAQNAIPPVNTTQSHRSPANTQEFRQFETEKLNEKKTNFHRISNIADANVSARQQ